MNVNFKPSTLKLFKVVGWDDQTFKSSEYENYQVSCVMTELGNRAYREGAWATDEQILDTLREALSDHRHDYAGDSLAYALVRYGCRLPDTLAGLHAWDGMMFKWQRAGMTAERVVGMLQEAGVAEAVAPDVISKINAWIHDPATALDNHIDIAFALLDKRMVFSSLRDVCFQPRNDELFKMLVQRVMPTVQIQDVSQTLDSEQRFTDVTESTDLTKHTAQGTQTYRADADPQLVQEGVRVLQESGAHWVVRFEHNGKRHAFFAMANGTWMDTEAVITGFNQFMASLGKSERAFRLGMSRSDNGEFGVFVVANGNGFPVVAEQLGIPLHNSSDH